MQIESREVMAKLEGIMPKHCDRCGHAFTEHNFEIIRNDDAATAVHVKCSSCDNNFILNMFAPVNGLVGTSRAQVNLDFSNSKEIIKFAGLKSIDTNEALDAFNKILKTEALEAFLKQLDVKEGQV